MKGASELLELKALHQNHYYRFNKHLAVPSLTLNVVAEIFQSVTPLLAVTFARVSAYFTAYVNSLIYSQVTSPLCATLRIQSI